MLARRPFLAAALGAVPLLARAQEYPNRPIRFFVPISAGSGTDAVARFMATALQQALKTTVLVENRPGGGGVIGTDVVAKAAPDGYTLLMTYAAHYSNQWIVEKMPYDTVRDFSPIATLANSVLVAYVPPDSPFRSIRDVIEEARRKPGSLSYGSAGVGTTGHVCGALLCQQAKVQMAHVPYKNASQVPLDVASGVLHLGFSGPSSVLPLVRSGRVRAIAVTTRSRSVNLPEVPTIDESGLPGYDIQSPIWAMGPAHLPADIAARLAAVMLRAGATPEFRQTCMAAGLEVLLEDTETARAGAQAEYLKWKRLAELTGAKPG